MRQQVCWKPQTPDASSWRKTLKVDESGGRGPPYHCLTLAGRQRRFPSLSSIHASHSEQCVAPPALGPNHYISYFKPLLVNVCQLQHSRHRAIYWTSFHHFLSALSSRNFHRRRSRLEWKGKSASLIIVLLITFVLLTLCLFHKRYFYYN